MEASEEGGVAGGREGKEAKACSCEGFGRKSGKKGIQYRSAEAGEEGAKVSVLAGG